MKVSKYEIERNANIARNKAVLAELDIRMDLFPPKEVRQPKKSTTSQKRPRAETDENIDEPKQSPPKIARTESIDRPSGARRSARNAGKIIDYKSGKSDGGPLPLIVRNHSNKPGNAGPIGEGRARGGKKMYGVLTSSFLSCL